MLTQVYGGELKPRVVLWCALHPSPGPGGPISPYDSPSAQQA